MPRVPQIDANRSYRTGPTAAEASMAAFDDTGAGMRVLSHGLGDVATAASHISAQQRQLEEKRRLDDEYKWLVDAEGQFKDEAREFTVNPDNNSREDFGAATLAYLKERQKKYLNEAPSTRAKSRLKDILNSQIDSRTNAAINLGESTKLRNAQLGIDANIATAMEAFRADAAVSPYYAEQNLEPTRQLLHESVDARWGKMAPVVSAKLKETIDTQIVIGTAASSPEYARKVLGSKFIDERSRATLENHIESAEAGNMALARVQADTELTLRLNIGKRTGTAVDMPNKAIFGVFGKNAQAEEFRYRTAVEAHNESVHLIRNLRDKVGPYQDQALAKANASNPTAAAMAEQMIEQNQKLQEQDPAIWAMNNSDVFNAFQKAGNDPQALALAYDLSWEHQGPPPVGASPEEAAKYLSLATDKRHLLGRADAEQKTAMILKGSIDEQLKQLDALQAQFPNKRHWSRVYNDLVTLPSAGKGIPKELQLAFLIDNPTNRKQFVVAISNTEGLKGLTEDKAVEFKDKLTAHPTWKAFQNSMISDMAGGADKMLDYKNGIIKYSFALAKGRTPKEAVALAVQHVIEDQMWPTKVNGQDLMIPRRREHTEIGPNLPDRTTEEIEDLGRRLALELKTLDPRLVQRVDEYGRPRFPNSPRLPDGNPKVEQYVRDIITSQGYYVLEDDGQSVTVYVTDGGGGPAFQVRDKRGQPFEMPLDWVRQFSTRAPSPMQWKMIDIKDQPQKTYDLLQDIYPGAWGQGSKRLNWPTNDLFFRQLQKPGFQVPPGPAKAISP